MLKICDWYMGTYYGIFIFKDFDNETSKIKFKKF